MLYNPCWSTGLHIRLNIILSIYSSTVYTVFMSNIWISHAFPFHLVSVPCMIALTFVVDDDQTLTQTQGNKKMSVLFS